MGLPPVFPLLGCSAALVSLAFSFPSGQGGFIPTNNSLGPRTFVYSSSDETIERFPLEYTDSDTENESDVGSGSINQSTIIRAMQKKFPKHISRDAEQYLTSPWLTLFVPSVYTLVVTLSLPLNIMAILMFLVKMKIRKPAVVYMLNLASADVLFVSVLPFKISYHFSGNNWVFGPEMCRFVTAAFYCNMYCSIMLMTAISIDRLLAVVYPMQALSWRTLGRASMVCFTIWVIAIAGVVPLLITEQTKRIRHLNITTCHDVLDELDLKGYYLHFFTIFSSLFFLVPFVISSVCYVCIIQCLKSSDIVAKQSKKTRAVLLSISVFSVFIICFGPTNILLLIHYIHFSYNNYLENIYFAYLLCVCISSINCCIDPLIYYYASSECQQQLRSLLCGKQSSEPCSSSISGQSVIRTSRRDTCTSTLGNSVYRKLLT
ncbi:proteinase-activated receptor 1-like [Sphaerodactylus townsendi]|uniref:proteinase-activated receptor 1-like n=1 Tax=Sphaerodactylus townsendi TaxID=933632 RepID=UPI0020271C2E|nr:proteinase-activated receptor 1-like [Sphaerodactylus townsendi]